MSRFAVSVLVALFVIFYGIEEQFGVNAQGFPRVSRCMSICRRNEQSLCQRCLFREPMRFGKRAATFREPMRFGRAGSAAFREPMRFGKRPSNSAAFREMMRFGKRADGSGSVAFREPMRFGKRTINNGTETRVMNIADWILEQQQDSQPEQVQDSEPQGPSQYETDVEIQQQEPLLFDA